MFLWRFQQVVFGLPRGDAESLCDADTRLFILDFQTELDKVIVSVYS